MKECLAKNITKEANFSNFFILFSDSSQMMLNLVGIYDGQKSYEILKKFDDVISNSKV